ncbi:MAG: hypothetical protein ACKVYV_02020 [Limisphaerales bacterium]
MNAPVVPTSAPALARRGELREPWREPPPGAPRLPEAGSPLRSAPALQDIPAGPEAGAPLRPVNLHIGRLVLDGLELGSRETALLQDAFEAELAARLGRGPLPSPGALASLPAPALAFPHGASPAAMGRALAGALAGVLGGREERRSSP